MGEEYEGTLATLAPCPFCGSRHTVIMLSAHAPEWYGHCEVCQCEGPTAKNEKDAQTLWDQRAQIEHPG